MLAVMIECPAVVPTLQLSLLISNNKVGNICHVSNLTFDHPYNIKISALYFVATTHHLQHIHTMLKDKQVYKLSGKSLPTCYNCKGLILYAHSLLTFHNIPICSQIISMECLVFRWFDGFDPDIYEK